MGKKNVLFILADEHRCDCIGAYGNREVSTPNLDELAAHGTLYRECYCTYPVCTPSRYSLFTGLYPHQHGAWNNHCTIGRGYETFPRVLKKAGYTTACVGKMHFAPTYLDIGFDTMLLSEQDGPGRMEDDYHEWLKQQGRVDCLDIMDQRQEYREMAPQDYWEKYGSGVSDLPEEMHSTTWIGENALEQLETWNPETSNFLMVGFIKPHHPFDPPAFWLEKYRNKPLSLLPGWTDKALARDEEKHTPYFPNEYMTPDVMKRITASYYACISQIDYWVGRLTDLLKEKGLYDDTLIVYNADHGDYMGYHHMLLKQNHLYDPVVRIPLIVKKPGEQKRSTVSDQLISNADLASSILEWVGIGSDTIEGNPIEHTNRKWIAAEQRMNSQWEYMIRSKEYKLLITPDSELLFDLKNDPYELEDIADKKPEIVAEAKEALLSWLAFEQRRHVYLDETSPENRAPVQAQREPAEMAAYFAENFRIPELD